MANKTTTVRVDVETYKSLKKLSEQLNQPMQKIIQEAIAEYKRKFYFQQLPKLLPLLKKTAECGRMKLKKDNCGKLHCRMGLNNECKKRRNMDGLGEKVA